MQVLRAVQNAKTLYEHVFFCGATDSINSDSFVKQGLLLDINFYNSSDQIMENIEKFQQVYNLLENSTSRELYTREMTWLILSKLIGIKMATKIYPVFSHEMWAASIKVAEKLLPSLGELHYPDYERDTLLRALAESFVTQSYNYEDVLTVETGEVFFDCGSYLLETSLWALSKGAHKCYAFEPNIDLLPYLKQTKMAHARKDDIHVVPLGTSNKSGMVNFVPDAASSRISENGESCIQVCSIDDFCQSQGVVPTFIKMDIEGAEVDSLAGAKQIIQKYKPKLAICLYHKMSHMWEIPLYIKSIAPEYKFYCKKNSLYYDFVLYAVANEEAPHE